MADRALERFESLFGYEFGHGKPLNLAALRAGLAALGAPQTKLAPIIHVAGTNGKGSTIAFMRAIAEAAGLKVHAFTKPHLLQLNGRFVVANKVVADAALIGAAERVAAAAPELTQFDAQVASAFVLFSETQADLVLLETGMGGGDNSTNIVERPALAVITPIGFDHQDALGDTLAEIAAHKAGILKPAIAGIIARQPQQAREAIDERAAAIGAPLFRQGVEWDAYANAGRLVVQTQMRALDLPLPALHGAHQIDNAGLACAALLQWRDFEDSAFAAGLTWARWPGRLQPLTRGPLSAPIRAVGGEVWVDGGHNGHAAAAIVRALDDMQRKRPTRTIAIVAMLARKDAPGFIQPLAKGVDHVIAVELDLAGAPPARIERMPPRRIKALAEERGIGASTANSLAKAMQNAAQFAAPRVIICGSFAIAAEALAAEAER